MKIDVILSVAKHRTRKKTHKYSFELPTTVEEAIGIDTKNGNNLLWESIDKEILNIGIDFELLFKVMNPTPWMKKYQDTYSSM